MADAQRVTGIGSLVGAVEARYREMAARLALPLDTEIANPIATS